MIPKLIAHLYDLPVRIRLSWFTSGSYSFVVPDNISQVIVAVQGAGASGSSPANNVNNYGTAASGSSGGFALAIINVSSGQSIPITIGQGGIHQDDGSTSDGVVGTNGTASSFGTFVTSRGGDVYTSEGAMRWVFGGPGGTCSISSSAITIANVAGSFGRSGDPSTQKYTPTTGSNPPGLLGYGGHSGGIGTALGRAGYAGGGGGGGIVSGGNGYAGGKGGDGYIILWY
jgi:hypothetical protein